MNLDTDVVLWSYVVTDAPEEVLGKQLCDMQEFIFNLEKDRLIVSPPIGEKDAAVSIADNIRAKGYKALTFEHSLALDKSEIKTAAKDAAEKGGIVVYTRTLEYKEHMREVRRRFIELGRGR